MKDDLVQNAFDQFEKAAEGVTVMAAKDGGLPSVVNAVASVCIAVRNVLAVAIANHDLHLDEESRKLRNSAYTKEQLLRGDAPPEVKAAMDRFQPERGVTKESILFAALLTVRMSPERDHANETVPVEFSPMVVLDTMRDYETLTGKRPDEFLNQGMVATARKYDGFGAEQLAAIVQAHKNSPNLPNTLN